MRPLIHVSGGARRALPHMWRRKDWLRQEGVIVTTELPRRRCFASKPSSDEPVEVSEGAKFFIGKMYGPGRFPGVTPDPVESRVAMETGCRRYGGPYVQLRRVEDLTVTSHYGAEKTPLSVPIRVYWPSLPGEDRSGPLPVLLYAHGGGWTRGSVNTTDQLCRRLAKDGKMAVVSVDYRLCPEVTYPAHLDDVEAAYQWLLTQPDMDGTRLVVAGDSAGGQLVTALQTRLHQRNQPMHLRPRAQALIYPALDMSCTSPSYTRFAEGYGLSREAMQNFIHLYLGGDARLQTVPEVSPLNLTDVGFFPPTLALLAEADPLRDDCHRFVAKLQTAGVRTHEVVYPKTVHAFITHFDVFPESAMAVAEMAAFFNQVIGKGPKQ